MPRKAWLVPLLLTAALVIQLTLLNGLRLPGGGVPDLALVLVAAFAMADGPIYGMALGFGTGLSLDLAPPASQYIGQYALVFLLAGWAAGRLSTAASKSAPRAAALVAVVVTAAEALAAGLGLVLEPDQVSLAQVRVVLPATIVYNLLLCPFVLYLVMLVSTAAEGGLAGRRMAGLMTIATRGQRAEDRKRPRLEPRLGQAGRHGEGWVAGAPARGHGALRPAGRPARRLRPGNGVAGSASGFVRGISRPATTANLRLTAPRRRDGAIGNAVGHGEPGPARRPGRHPGQLATRRQFRPQAGEYGGSASASSLTRPVRGLAGRRATLRFGAHRGDAVAGSTLGAAAASSSVRRAGGAPRLRMGASRSALSRGSSSAAVPKLSFSRRKQAVRRPRSTPKFRRRSSWLRPSATASGLVSGGALNHSTAGVKRHRPVSRLRLRSGGVAVIGGSSRGIRPRRTSVRGASRPNFGYGKRSLVSFLTGRRIGGRWLASKRVGTRSGVWLIGNRTGGAR
jgi:rod shape-determining protein MreD